MKARCILDNHHEIQGVVTELRIPHPKDGFWYIIFRGGPVQGPDAAVQLPDKDCSIELRAEGPDTPQGRTDLGVMFWGIGRILSAHHTGGWMAEITVYATETDSLLLPAEVDHVQAQPDLY